MKKILRDPTEIGTSIHNAINYREYTEEMRTMLQEYFGDKRETEKRCAWCKQGAMWLVGKKLRPACLIHAIMWDKNGMRIESCAP